MQIYARDDTSDICTVNICTYVKWREYLAGDILMLIVAEAVGLVQVVHGTVVGIHELILQELCVRQVPSPPALLQAAAVACMWAC